MSQLLKYAKTLSTIENSGRFYQAVDAVTDALELQYPSFLDRLLTADGDAFIPSLRFYAITGTAKIITPEGK